MNPQADLLSQLRDIHAAPAAPWWPPAPGWWFVALLLAVAMLLGLRFAWTAVRGAWRKRCLQRWVDDIEANIDPLAAPQEFLCNINRVIKLVALEAFPDQHCAHLQGEAWSGFVQAHLGDSPDTACLGVLADGPYRPHPEFDPAVMGRLARAWIRRHG